MTWIFERGNGGAKDSVTTAILPATTITRYDESGNATIDTLAIGGYEINASRVGLNGTGNIGDSLQASAGNDAIIWDDTTTNQAATIFGSQRFGSGWNNQNQAADVFALYGGNDLLNLTSSGTGNEYAYNATAYGGDGSDVLWSGQGNDFLYGDEPISDGGVDTLFGGAGNDALFFSRDTVVAGGGAGDYVQAWDGESGAAFSAGYSAGGWSADFFNGGTGNDSLVGSSGADLVVMNSDDIYVGGIARPANAGRITSIEVVILGSGADILSLTDVTGSGSGTVYAGNLSAFGNDGADLIVSGSGNDLLVGGNGTLGGATTDADIIYGGAGGDVIWGDDQGDTAGTVGGADTLYGGGGSDTLYGGGGNDFLFGGASGLTDADTIYGGAGDDTLFATDSTNVFGGDGKDVINSALTKSASNFNFLSGLEGASDGADKVVVTGSYNLMSGSLGAGDDSYVAKADGAGTRSDVVDGQSGNDAIATWAGADTIYGGDGTDVLWGGAGSDVMFGGNDTDFLYAQDGNDTIYGGAGWDMVYFGRNDGSDQYYDLNREGGAGARENWLVVYGAFDQNEAGASVDFLLNGAGVRESDHSLAEPIDGANMAHLIANGGTSFTLQVGNVAGDGLSTISFDSRDVAGIGLWDNDLSDGHVLQVYIWNGSTYVYSYSA